MYNDDVMEHADTQVDAWRSSQHSTDYALKPNEAILRMADETIRIRVELTAIRRALQKIANK